MNTSDGSRFLFLVFLEWLASADSNVASCSVFQLPPFDMKKICSHQNVFYGKLVKLNLKQKVSLINLCRSNVDAIFCLADEIIVILSINGKFISLHKYINFNVVKEMTIRMVFCGVSLPRGPDGNL